MAAIGGEIVVCYTVHMLRAIALLVFSCCLAAPAFGQACPQANPTGPDAMSGIQKLRGQLFFHDSLRQWFELKLDKLQCGQHSIQLVRGDQSWTPLQVLRGCAVQSLGVISISSTGYYSLDMSQYVDSIEAVEPCTRQKPFPDYSKAKPARDIRSYRVVMHIYYGHEDFPVRFRVTTAGRELRPWQAYASYDLTGGFVLYGRCGEGFVVNRVFGAGEANPGYFDEARTPADMAMFDPESAAARGKQDLQLGYTCVRSQ